MRPQLRPRLRVSIPFLALFFVLGCGGPAAGGGADAGPDGGAEPEPPTWDSAAVDRTWAQVGIGEGFSLLSLPDGEGGVDLVVGGRRLARLGPETFAGGPTDWQLTWPEDASMWLGPENRWVSRMAAFDALGDEALELLVVEHHNGHLVSQDGEYLGWIPLETSAGPYDLAVFGSETGVPDFAVAGKEVAAYSGATGERLWELEFEHAAVFLEDGRFDASGERALVIGLEVSSFIALSASAASEDVPAVFGVTAAGEPIFEFAPSGMIWSMVATDLDGAGLDEVVVGTDQGTLHAVGADGVELWRATLGAGIVRDLEHADLDGDGRPELLAAFLKYGQPERTWVVALDADGNELWRHDAAGANTKLQLHRLETGEHTVVVTEPTYPFAPGVLVAFDALDGTLLFKQYWGTLDSALVRLDGVELLAVAGGDTVVRALHPRTGEMLQYVPGGGFVQSVATGDLDGDGIDEVVAGEFRGRVAVRDVSGALKWEAFLEGVEITAVAAGEVAPGQYRVIAAGLELENMADVLRIWDGEGNEIHDGDRAQRLAYQVDLVDMDGDGVREIVLGAIFASGCGVQVLDPAGAKLGQRVIAPCLVPVLSIAAPAPGELPEIGMVAIPNFNTVPYAALIENDLTVRWARQLDWTPYWPALVEGDLLVAGERDSLGSVARLGYADGLELWRHDTTPVAAPEDPAWLLSSRITFGTLVPGAGLEGGMAAALSGDDNRVHLIDTTSGQPIWEKRFEAADTLERERRKAGPITYVPATVDTPPWLLMVETADRQAGQAYALDLDGELLGTFVNEGYGADADLARTAEGRLGVAAGVGMSVQLYEAAAIDP